MVDGGVATTTGITASMPMTLTLIEAIAGREKAEAVARDLGLAHWDARHDSDAFKFTRPFALTAIGNRLAFWNRKQLGIELAPGVDEVSLALVADAWSRTYRSRAVTFAGTAARSRRRTASAFCPIEVAHELADGAARSDDRGRPPAQALDQALQGIAGRYGTRTADFVAMQLEYPRQAATRCDDARAKAGAEAEGDRTPDLRIANAALSRLGYGPDSVPVGTSGGRARCRVWGRRGVKRKARRMTAARRVARARVSRSCNSTPKTSRPMPTVTAPCPLKRGNEQGALNDR